MYSSSFKDSMNTEFSKDPPLEAFRCYPADGNIAILVYRLTAFAKYLNELFLSY